jgi:uncharacterized repeat protein (TIGR01451 family)
MKKFILIIGFLAVLIGISDALAQTAPPPGLKIGLVQTKTDYSPGERIPLVLSLLNTGGQIITSLGFSQRPFYLYLAFTDPDGQVIHSYKLTGDPLDPEETTKHLDPPPPPQILIINNEFVPVELVENIDPNWALSFDNFNALDFYTLVKGGKYCIKAQIPMKTYSGSFDNGGQQYARLNWVNWAGLLESLPVCFNLNLPVNADLLVAQTAPSTISQGSELTYAITLVNKGPDTARNVTLTDILPSGVAFISASPKQYNCKPTGNTVTCNLGNITNQDSTTVSLLVTSTSAGAMTNTVTVSSDATDPVSTNNTSQVTTTVAVGTPRISGTIDGKGKNDQGIFYVDLKLTNTGTGNARNIKITKINFSTLSGTGTVSYNTSLSPAFPITAGSLDVNASIKIRLYLNVPKLVTRFSINETGAFQDLAGRSNNLSLGQAVIP